VPTQAVRPPNSGEIAGEPDGLIVREQRGSVIGAIPVPVAGRYEVWLQGSFGQRIQVTLGGRHVGSAAYELGPPGQFVRIGDATLPAGKSLAVITWPASGVAPGEEASDHLLGPLMLVPSGTRLGVSFAAPAQSGSLCGRSLDWIEIVR
jgi:hypothetical protein